MRSSTRLDVIIHRPNIRHSFKPYYIKTKLPRCNSQKLLSNEKNKSKEAMLGPVVEEDSHVSNHNTILIESPRFRQKMLPEIKRHSSVV